MVVFISGLPVKLLNYQATVDGATWTITPNSAPCIEYYIVSLNGDPSVLRNTTNTMISNLEFVASQFPLCSNQNITITPFQAGTGNALTISSITGSIVIQDPGNIVHFFVCVL